MQTRWFVRMFNQSPRWLSLVLGLVVIVSAVSAAEIRLKNGTMIRGQMLVMGAMSDRPVGMAEIKAEKDAAPVPRPIARVDTGWQRFYFPLQQDSRQQPGPVRPNPTNIKLPPPKKQAKVHTVTGFGAIIATDPFSDFGIRHVTIGTKSKSMDVFQAITDVYPDHVLIESTNCEWKLGLGLKNIPMETLDKLLKKKIKRTEPVERFALVRFYAEAEYFPQAFQELAGIAADFPDQKEIQEKVQTSQTELMNYFGKEILRRLGHRKRAGQHLLAEDFAKKLSDQGLTGTVQQDVQQYVRGYEQTRQTIERAKLLLGEWQSKLSDPAREKLLEPLRSEINDQLNFESLPRLDAFLKAEGDNQYKPDQRLGLAYSGWILGAANAVPDLEQSLRVWEARTTVLQYLRSEDPGMDAELLKKLQSAENIGHGAVLNMAAQLPPILDDMGYEPGTPSLVETESDPQTNYWVTLPAEYSHHHSYPLVIALRPGHRTAEQTLAAWAGDANDVELGFNRGYIVIAPEYAEKNAREYSFGTQAHKYVIDCLIDARKRFAVDSDRVFLVGHGMGGDAAYDIGMAVTDEFAGVVPMGGNAINYCLYTWENGSYTDWYAIGKGYDVNGTRDITSNPVLDKILKHGAKFDFIYAEYQGRNGESLVDEIPKLYDWMDLHTRNPQPKQFKVCSLRKADDRFFWVTAGGLPRDYILPGPTTEGRRISPMDIDVKATPGNSIFLKSPTENYTLRLTPDLVDFETRVAVKINGRMAFRDFIKPSVNVMLEELRQRGDRKRLPWAVLTPADLTGK